MSTIRKIDKQHRARTTDRAARQLYFAAAAMSGPNTLLGIVAAQTFKILEGLRKDSTKTGADKDRLHAAVMAGWEANKVKIRDQMRASAEVKPNDETVSDGGVSGVGVGAGVLSGPVAPTSDTSEPEQPAAPAAESN